MSMTLTSKAMAMEQVLSSGISSGQILVHPAGYEVRVSEKQDGKVFLMPKDSHNERQKSSLYFQEFDAIGFQKPE